MRSAGLVCLALAAMSIARPCVAQEQTLTLAEARQRALARQPQILSAELGARAAEAQLAQARAANYPLLSAAVSSVVAPDDAAVSAGALTTSALASRAAAGVTATQLLTDFGRTARLVDSAQLRAAARDRQSDDVRARVLLEVSLAYYEALGADTVLRVAQADLEARQVLLRQIRALAESDLRSTLDVSFAEIAVSEGELALDRARNRQEAARARLSAAVGEADLFGVTLVDEALPVPLGPESTDSVAAALRARSDLAALALERDAARRFADAERRLSMPTVAAQGAAGVNPARTDRLHQGYSAAGVNVTVPVLNGGLFSARQTEAALRAEALARDVDTLSLAITRDVRVAWLNSRNAFLRLDLTARLVEQSATALRLAQSRYDLGLSAIVELTQAQVAQTSAQVAAASAKYEYLASRALLAYSTGALP